MYQFYLYFEQFREVILGQLTVVVCSSVILAMLTSCYSSNEKNTNANQLANGIKNSNFHQAIIDNRIDINSNGINLSEQDLALFAKSLEDKKIVGLGEQTHGAGSVFRLKTQLIKYLHEHHGFDVLILESGMFDVNKIWQEAQKGIHIKGIAPDNIFYMYAKTTEVTPLFDYINERVDSNEPLILVGFDSQHTGGISNKGLVDALTVAVNQSSGNINEFTEWQLFVDQVQHVLNVNNTQFNSEVEKLFFQQLNDLQKLFLTDTTLELTESRFWYRITKGLEAQAKRQWNIADNRSQEMGENIKYWAEQYPNKKIIVWAHTWHLTRDGRYQINAGQIVAEAFGNKYFMVHFTGATGEYLDFVTMKNKNIMTNEPDTFEKLLNNKVTTDISLLNLIRLDQNKDNTSDKATLIFANDYQHTLPANQWATFFDGVFFIKNIVAANYHD